MLPFTAVRCAAAKYKGPTWLTATAAHIPVEKGSAQLVTSLFALTLPEEGVTLQLQQDGFLRMTLADAVIYLMASPLPEA